MTHLISLDKVDFILKGLNVKFNLSSLSINNETENNYEKPVITDIIDTSLVTFIDGSVTIDGTKATSSEYKYDEQTHRLTVNLDTITPSSSSTLTFLVKKKS